MTDSRSADVLRFAAVCKEAARHWEFAATFAARHNQSDNGAASGAAALRALAALCEKAKRLWDDEASFDDPTRAIADLLHALAAGYTPERRLLAESSGKAKARVALDATGRCKKCLGQGHLGVAAPPCSDCGGTGRTEEEKNR